MKFTFLRGGKKSAPVKVEPSAAEKLERRIDAVEWASMRLLEAHVGHTKISKVDGEAVAQAIRVADLHCRLMERFERELKGESGEKPEAAA